MFRVSLIGTRQAPVEDDLEISREKISEVANGIRTGSFETKKSDYNCQYCDYKDFICPAWED